MSKVYNAYLYATEAQLQAIEFQIIEAIKIKDSSDYFYAKCREALEVAKGLEDMEVYVMAILDESKPYLTDSEYDNLKREFWSGVESKKYYDDGGF